MEPRAHIGEIVSVIGYPGMLFLVRNRGKDTVFAFDGTAQTMIIYACEDIDKPGPTRVIYDTDIDKIIVPAHKVDEFLANRKGSFQPPAVQVDMAQYTKQFMEAQARAKSKEQPKSKHEEERLKREEQREYLDYLLDVHSMLNDLETMLGSDDTRREEMRMIKEEFREKSIELYGRNSN